jgi:hypothetical protein
VNPLVIALPCYFAVLKKLQIGMQLVVSCSGWQNIPYDYLWGVMGIHMFGSFILVNV